jgi:hypothetical protein
LTSRAVARRIDFGVFDEVGDSARIDSALFALTKPA